MDRVWQKASFFALLYMLQGAVFAYVVNFQKPFLMASGVSSDALGLFSALLLVPFILKVFLGALSDKVPIGRLGRRKPYMILGLTLFAGGYAAAGVTNPESHFMLFAYFSWMAALGLAWFDTCCDGWAVDITHGHEEGLIQGAMVAGRALGLVLMSLAFGYVASTFGFASIFFILAGAAALVATVVVFCPYKPVGGPRSSMGQTGEIRELATRPYLIFAAFGILYSVASFGTDGLMTLHLADRQLAGPVDMGVFGVFRGLGAIVGAIFLARLSALYPLKYVMSAALLILGLGCLSPLVGLSLASAGMIWGMAWGLQETAYVTLAMVYARGAWAATFFSVAMIFSNLGTAIGEGLGVPLALRFGYEFVFMAFAGLAWLTILVVPRLRLR